jgi:hypothetical protein
MISDAYADMTLLPAIFAELLGNKRRGTRAADRGHRRQFRRRRGGTQLDDLAGKPPAASPHSSWVSAG